MIDLGSGDAEAELDLFESFLVAELDTGVGFGRGLIVDGFAGGQDLEAATDLLDEVVVLEVAGGGEGDVSAEEAVGVVAEEGVLLEALDGFAGAKDGLGEGMAFPEGLGEDFVDEVVGVVLVDLDFFKDDAALAVDVVMGKDGVEDDVGKDVDGGGDVLVEDLDVEADGFLAGESVDVAADGVDFASDVLGGAVFGALEDHVLDEVGDAIDFGQLVAGAGIDPDAHGDGADVVHALGEDGEAVGECGALNVAFLIHKIRIRSRSCSPNDVRERGGGGDSRGVGYPQDGMTSGGKILTTILDARGCERSHPLFGLNFEQLMEALGALELPGWRIRQVEHALYREWVGDLSEVTTLPVALRDRLAGEGFWVGLPEIVESFESVDGTERYLIAGLDGQTVETVWMPGGDGGETGDGSEEDAAQRATICVSSQIGCAVNCQFCLTAQLGIVRNLTAGEIAGQVVAVLKRQQVKIGRDRINLVFMGMGEPFLNYDAFMDAVRLLVEEVGIPASRMTVSTSGIVPGILRFAEETVRPKLAISLNAPDDAIRAEVMPINRKWDIAAVLTAVRKVPLRPKERVTFEYVLLGGVNDRQEDAEKVVKLLRRANLPLKVNLIVWNPGPGTAYRMPEAGDVAAFQEYLVEKGIPAYIRRPRGRDIYAACGQLKRTVREAAG